MDKGNYVSFTKDNCNLFQSLEDEDKEKEQPREVVEAHVEKVRELSVSALKSIGLLDERELYDYLDGKGEWSYPEQ
jgi:hypothetical protein